MATGCHHALVQGGLGPADRSLEVQVLVAFVLDEVEDLVDGVAAGADLVLLHAQAEGQARRLADRVADAHTTTQAVHGVAGNVHVQLVVVSGAVEGVVAQADAIDGPVGVDEAEVVAGLVLGAGQADADLVAGTEEVVLADGAAQDQARALGEAHAGGDGAGRLLFDGVVHVYLVIGTRHLRGLDVHFLEEAQALEAGLGLVDQVGRRPATFHLAHFTAQHLVFGLGVATEVDAVDVGTLAWVDGEGHGDGVVFVVGLGDAVDVGEGVALVAQATGDQLGGGGHHLAGEHLPFLDQQQRLHFFLGHLEVAGELHVANGVLLAFIDVDGDVDVLLVGGDGHLSGRDVHVDIAAVQVVGTQALQVTGELLAGVLVVVLEEGQPVGGLQLEQVDQVFVGEHGVADDVDVLDRSDRAFVDVDLQRDAVARLGNHVGLDLRGVTTLGHVLALQLVTHALEGRTLEDFTLGEARLLEALQQVFGTDGLVALDLDAGDGRTFDYADDQHTAVAAELDVLEETGLEQGTGGFDQAAIISLVAYVQRQGAEDAACGYTLQAVDADVGYGEGLGVNFADHECGKHRG